jgi:hypothetical protein
MRTFWSWFRAGPGSWQHVAQEVFDRQRSTEIVDEFERAFPEAVHPQYPAGILLLFEEETKGSCRIVFSLHMNRDETVRPKLARLLDRLVAAAPTVSGWQFQALQKAGRWQDGYLPRLDLPEDSLKIDNMRFVVRHEAPLSLCIFLPSYQADRARAFRIGVERVLEMGMGERWVLESLSSLEIASTSSTPQSARPLRELSKLLAVR